MAGKSLNKVQLIGHLGKDPELRYTSNGQAVATFSLATNERRKKPNSDEYEDFTEWHNIVAWGRTAEIASEFLNKGKQTYIEGRLQTRSWDDQNGVKRYTTEIVAQDLILLSSGRGESGGGGRPPHPADTYDTPPSAPASTGAPAYTGKVAEPRPAPSMPADVPPDDIPF
ncbi:single-stranded DNA-binding protein [Candidatus Moduliflexus flocculans]|uniref:Single-stranded DNA-binding protein n=1 Tax=Candidatus Moduliflexus flocculans TaxID=1499966 RepID=A0A0S6VR64_9BACT|nr:single-stranded DNA-binding protein [Candidatus Moduliflexus flocculans]